MTILLALVVASLVSGVICITAGIKMGRNMEQLRRNMGLPPAERKETKPYDPGMCGCNHHKAFHNAEKGCRVEVTTREKWNNKASDYEDVPVYCTCQAFVAKVAPSSVIRTIEPTDWQTAKDEARKELEGL